MNRPAWIGTIGFGCWVVLAVVGCGSSDESKDPPASIFRLKAIGQAYALAAQDLSRGPKNKDEIIPYLPEDQGDPKELFRSSVDNEDFVIIWGIDFRKMNPKEQYATVTAYEKDGENGKRYVLRYRSVSLASESELTKMKFPPGAAPP